MDYELGNSFSGFAKRPLIFLLKFSIYTPVYCLGSTSFSKNIIVNPILFEVMANSAFCCLTKQSSPIFRTHFCNMLLSIKILMNMTTSTIFSNYLIISLRIKLPLKRTRNLQWRATCFQTHKKNKNNPE